MNQQTKWSIDQAHSDITFKIGHLMIAHVKGSFKIFDASVYTTDKDFNTAEIDLWIDPASIVSGDSKRDEHLKSAEFFDVERYTQISFNSSTIGPADSDGIHELWGELTMKGITQVVQLKVRFGGIVIDPQGNEKSGFSITGKLARKDWGLDWNSALDGGGFMVSEEVHIACDMELINMGHNDLILELDQSNEPNKKYKVAF